MSLLTGWEANGRWSSLQEEESFLRALALTTGLRLFEAGRSVAGNQIWWAELGANSGPTLFIAAGVHGRELCGREAVLAWLRDLAQSQDPATVNYLQTHRIVAVPCVNPDGASIFVRENANGIDLNRDYLQLTQPETRAVKKVINATDPQIILDLHAVTTGRGYNWKPFPGGMPGAYPALQGLCVDLLDQAQSDALDEGFTSEYYEEYYMPWSGLSVVASAWHKIGILSEPGMDNTRADRIEIQTILLESARTYHAANQSEIASTILASKEWAETSSDPVPIPTQHRWADSNGTLPVTYSTRTSYEPDGFLPMGLMELQGILVDDGVVATHQEARLLVVALLDPRAYELAYSVDNPWWFPAEPPRVHPKLGLWVKDGNVRRRVREAWVKDGNVRRRL